MTAQEFLELLLPSSGFYFTATLKDQGGWRNTCHKTIASMVEHAASLTFNNTAAYFALASYEQDKVWSNAEERYQERTQDNTQALKCFFLDLDVGSSENKFPSKAEALRGLQNFCRTVGLPKPLLVDSGGGIHCYWPFSEAVDTRVWRPVADQLKAICIAEKFHVDMQVAADQARVLRIPGGYNFRRGAPVKIISEKYHVQMFEQLRDTISNFAANRGVQQGTRQVVQADDLPSNLGVEYESNPSNFDAIAFGCGQVGIQLGEHGRGASEPIWRATLGIAKHCQEAEKAAVAVSNGHPGFNERATLIKLHNWKAGPTICATFHAENPAVCEACPHWKQITSPIQLGKIIPKAPEREITIVDAEGVETEIALPEAPFPYYRSADGVLRKSPKEEEDDVEICPHDFYPVKILRQNAETMHVDERSFWRADLDRIGTVELDIKQSMLADTKGIYAYLLGKGLYINAGHAKALPTYMSAYLRKLASTVDREHLFERLGWHNEHSCFVLGEHVYYRDGRAVKHIPGKEIKNVSKDALKTAGSLEAWKDNIRFYAAPQYAGHRFFLYASLAAPLLHMAGHRGVTMNANGMSGRGKTTCLLACMSMWGSPEELLINGNKDGATYNKMYDMLGMYHSLPFPIDDTTERDPEEIRKMVLNIPQGKGKERMNSDREARTWETIALTTSNTDDLARIQASAHDSGQSLMRLVSVEFSLVDTSPDAKALADQFSRSLRENYGHVGPAFMQYVLKNYEQVKKMVEDAVAKIDRESGSRDASAERYWTAAAAVCYVAATIAKQLGFIPFDAEADLNWIMGHLRAQRITVTEGMVSAAELLAEFLDKSIPNTLVLSAKNTPLSNLDGIGHRPTQKLMVRHELDTGIAYISRNAIGDYCVEKRITLRKMESDLEKEGIILNKNVQKVLGSDTQYAGGQIRTWRVDIDKLGGGVKQGVLSLVQNNVAAMGGTP